MRPGTLVNMEGKTYGRFYRSPLTMLWREQMEDRKLREKHEKSNLYRTHGLCGIHHHEDLGKARAALQRDALDLLDDMSLIDEPIWAFGEEWADFHTVVRYFNKPKKEKDGTDKFGINFQKLFEEGRPFSGRQIFRSNVVLDFKVKQPGDKKNAMSVDVSPQTFLDYAREFCRPRIEFHQPRVVIAMGVDVTNALLIAHGQEAVRGSFNDFVDRVARDGAPQLRAGTHLVPVFHPGHFGWVVNRKRPPGKNADEQNIQDWAVALRY